VAQIGTLDALMQLSDDLAKADMVSEATVAKLVSALASLLERNMEKLESNLSANGSMGAGGERPRTWAVVLSVGG
jgi:hypothetical protein